MLAKVMLSCLLSIQKYLSCLNGTIESYLNSEPSLEKFKKYLTDLLETKSHKLSPDTEEALASLGEF